MFTDIVGYSRLMGQNEGQTIVLLGEYRRILLAQIQRYQGSVIEFIGDAVFARFDCPLAAVNAGIAIQHELAEFNLNSDPNLAKLQSRIGIHTGEVAIKDGALFGDDVNIAARLEPIAVADGLCISESVYRAVKDELKAPVLALGVQPLKNIKVKIRAYLVKPSGITFGNRNHYALRKLAQKTQAYRVPIAAALLLLVAAGFYFIPRWLVPGYTANYVEIADFKNLMSEDGAPDYFSAGITEALRSQLADIRDVYILEADKGVRGPIRLEGSVQKVGDNLRIAYRLFRRKDNVQIAGGKLDASYKDIFILQDRVVAEIASYLADEFSLENFRPAALNLTSDVTAYDYYLQGLEYLRKPQSHENFDQAIKLFSTALVHDDEFARANAGLCNAYRGKYKLTRTTDWARRAEEFCQLALAQDDSLSEVYESLGGIYRDTGREGEAVEILQKAISIDQQNVDAKIELARTYQKQNHFDESKALLEKVLEARPGYWRAYHQLAMLYFSNSRMDESIDVYLKLLKFTPENSIAFSNLGASYLFSGNYSKAARAFEKSVELNPSSWGYSNTGTMYYFSNDYDSAINMFKMAIRLSPKDFRWYLNLADVQRQIPKYHEEAIKNYRKSMELASEGLAVNPNDATLYQYLALAYLFTGDDEKGESFLEKAISLNPSDMDVLYTSVKFWTVKEEFDRALEALTRLISSGYSESLIAADPDLSSLRSQPRYSELLVKHDER